MSHSGQTIGKKIMRIRVVRCDGDRLGPWRWIFLRCLPIFALPALFFQHPVVGILIYLIELLLIFRDTKQCLHDQIADTMVVNR